MYKAIYGTNQNLDVTRQSALKKIIEIFPNIFIAGAEVLAMSYQRRPRLAPSRMLLLILIILITLNGPDQLSNATPIHLFRGPNGPIIVNNAIQPKLEGAEAERVGERERRQQMCCCGGMGGGPGPLPQQQQMMALPPPPPPPQMGMGRAGFMRSISSLFSLQRSDLIRWIHQN